MMMRAGYLNLKLKLLLKFKNRIDSSEKYL